MTKSNKWPKLFKAGLLSSTVNKHVQYIGLADKRAQTIITINAFLIPISLTVIEQEMFKMAVTVFIIAAVASMLCSIISLLPKRYGGDGHKKVLFHFSDIGEFSENAYLKKMQELLDDKEAVAEVVSRDLYHMSTKILIPKFKWLRRSYFIFLVGVVSCLGMILLNVF